MRRNYELLKIDWNEYASCYQEGSAMARKYTSKMHDQIKSTGIHFITLKAEHTRHEHEKIYNKLLSASIPLTFQAFVYLKELLAIK